MIQVINENTLADLAPRIMDVSIRFYRSGRIRLSSDLSAMMDLSGGDRVAFIRVDDHFYLAKEIKGSGFPVSGRDHLTISRKALVSLLSELMDLPINKLPLVKLPVATAPQYINGFHAHQILTHE